MTTRAQAAQDLHRIADGFRFLYGSSEQSSSRLKELAEHAESFWERRREMLKVLGNNLGPALERDVQLDMLDLAILGSNLRVSLAPPERRPAHAAMHSRDSRKRRRFSGLAACSFMSGACLRKVLVNRPWLVRYGNLNCSMRPAPPGSITRWGARSCAPATRQVPRRSSRKPFARNPAAYGQISTWGSAVTASAVSWMPRKPSPRVSPRHRIMLAVSIIAPWLTAIWAVVTWHGVTWKVHCKSTPCSRKQEISSRPYANSPDEDIRGIASLRYPTGSVTYVKLPSSPRNLFMPL